MADANERGETKSPKSLQNNTPNTIFFADNASSFFSLSYPIPLHFSKFCFNFFFFSM